MKVLRICLLLVFVCSLVTNADSIDMNGRKYIGMAKVNKKGELSNSGKYTLPYYMSFVSPDGKLLYGSMVQTGILSKESTYTVRHYGFTDGKLRRNKKLIFNLVKGLEIVQKKVIGKSSDGGQTFVITLKDTKDNKYNVTFRYAPGGYSGVYLGNISPDAGSTKEKTYPDSYGTMLTLIMPDNSSTVSAPESGYSTYMLNLINKNRKISEFHGSVYMAANFMYGKDIMNHILFEAETNNGPELGQFHYYPTGGDPEYGTLTTMGGNGTAPTFDPSKMIVDRFENSVVISILDKKNITPGCTAVAAGEKLRETCIVTNVDYSNGVEKVELCFSIYRDFSGPVTINLFNPNGEASSFTVNIPAGQ